MLSTGLKKGASMAVFKIGSNYRAEVFIDGFKVASKCGFKNKSLAQEWHNEQKVIFKTNPNFKAPDGNVLFSEMADKFINDYAATSVKESTFERYILDINRRIKPEFKNFRVKNITHNTIKAFQNKLLREGELGAASINRCLTLLHSIFERGIEFELCTINPCKKVKNLTEIKKPHRWWPNVGDITRFMKSLEGHKYYLPYKIALETGLRLGELVGLTWDNINIETGQITVTKQYCQKLKKYLPAKNSKWRTVWLSDATLPLLRLHKTKSKTDYVFSEPNGIIMRSHSLSGDFFKNQQIKAKVPVINFHGLRHTYASHFMMNCGNIYILSRLLGHSDIKITNDRYAHLSPQEIAENRNRVCFNDSNILVLEEKSLKNHSILPKMAISG